MRALLLSEYRQLAVVEVDEPTVAPDDVLIRVGACGICGSDVHGYDGSTGRRIPPLVMGHEAAGVVERVGRATTRFAAGDRVTFDSTICCGECRFCAASRINLCERREVMGVSCDEFRRHGAFAELVTVPERACYHLPPEIPLEHAALIEAVSVAVHAVARTPIVEGDTCVVIGAGMIGSLVVQALRASGAGRVLAVDRDASRLALAVAAGADDTVDASLVDAVEAIRTVTHGRGADHAFEVVGITDTVVTAIDAVDRGGTVTLVGNLSPKVEVPLQRLVNREINVFGSCASSGEYPRVIEMMVAGRIDVAPLISAVAPLADGPAWFERLYTGEPELFKVVLTP